MMKGMNGDSLSEIPSSPLAGEGGGVKINERCLARCVIYLPAISSEPKTAAKASSSKKKKKQDKKKTTTKTDVTTATAAPTTTGNYDLLS